MKAAIGCFIGLVFAVSASAEPLLEGRVRLESGEPVADAQVRIFDMTDLRQGAIARAMTDGTGYFALPLAALGGRALPARFALGPNYPNPFNPSTIIPYQLAASSAVRLEVFNLLGQRLATLVDGVRPAGFHTATWHATDGAGRAVGAGVYTYRMTVGSESQTGRMVLIDGQAGLSTAGVASVMPGASGIGGSNREGAPVYGLIVSGEGLVPYVDSAFRVESGTAPVELVVSAGQHSAGKATDDDCALCDLFGTFNDQQEEETPEEETPEEETPEEETPEEVPDDAPVTIPDAKLRAAIAKVLGKARGATITVAEMKTLTGLWPYDAGIRDLAGLEFATNLTGLGLGGNRITDVSPLSGLTNLEILRISRNNITNISPLSGLTNLEDLELVDNKVAALSPLRDLTNLEILRISRNEITDISPLRGLTNLKHLSLEDSGITALSPLEGLTSLEVLSLVGNEITDISPLRGLTNLTLLYLGSNKVADISPLRGLTNLTLLGLGRNGITDISPLRDLTSLDSLNLWINEITDISPLRGLTNLSVLYLDRNEITDISPLGGLTDLTELGLSSNGITDISPLRGLTNLEGLDIAWNFLNNSSLNDHIPALQSRGVTVFFTRFRESDFDIELVFLDDFTEDQKNVLRLVARRWMSVITEDLPDYEFTQGWSGECGDHSYAIPSGERIDDLRIYVTSFDGGDLDAVGWATPHLLREETHLSVLGCMGIDLERANLLITGLHEIGHVLGFGTGVWDNLGFRQDPNGDTHFNGPRAIAAFNDAGGRNYTGAKVPVDGSHWRYSVLEGDLMVPGGGRALSAITVQSLADLGYGVDVTQADPYTLPGAAAKASAKIAAAMPSILGVDGTQADVYTPSGSNPHWQGRVIEGLPGGRLERAEWIGGRDFGLRDNRLSLTGRLAPHSHTEPEPLCGFHLERNPIYVIDPQGRIVRTLGD